MTIKVRRIGNSLGIVLPKDLLDRLGATEGAELVATETAPGTIALSLPEPDFARQMEVARKGMRAYRNALRELAK